MTTEVDLRLRRIDKRITRIEMALRDSSQESRSDPPAVTRASTQWTEIANRLDALALKLKLHYEQAGCDGLPQALDELRDGLRDAFTATGNAIHDDAVRADVRDVGQLVAEAVANTLTTVSAGVRTTLRH
jgi:hypothetical protein